MLNTETRVIIFESVCRILYLLVYFPSNVRHVFRPVHLAHYLFKDWNSPSWKELTSIAIGFEQEH